MFVMCVVYGMTLSQLMSEKQGGNADVLYEMWE